jgi:allantoicase
MAGKENDHSHTKVTPQSHHSGCMVENLNTARFSYISQEGWGSGMRREVRNDWCIIDESIKNVVYSVTSFISQLSYPEDNTR